jgi:vancomycin permeability regulator SanA
MNSIPSVVVVLGAAVWEGGRASNAMRRRIEGALLSARSLQCPFFLVSGGVGKYPPSEAMVMAGLLQEAGIPAERILFDEASTDTLESIRNCTDILRNLPKFDKVIVCSDVYHIPRCRWLFKLYGIATCPGMVASGRSQNTVARWLYYHLRECAAIPWDTLLALMSRGRQRSPQPG